MFIFLRENGKQVEAVGRVYELGELGTMLTVTLEIIDRGLKLLWDTL
jgi:hypothetical protein